MIVHDDRTLRRIDAAATRYHLVVGPRQQSLLGDYLVLGMC